MEPRTYATGDSHALVYGDLRDLVYNCKGLGPVTMHKVGSSKMSFKAYFYEGSIVIFSFGEIDVRAHIWKQVQLGRDEDEVIEKLATEYIENLLRYKDTYRIIVASITPPIDAPEADNPDLPIFGSTKERSRYCKKLNSLLRSLCAAKELQFLDTYKNYADKNGLLIKELSDGSHHIGNTGPLREKLSKLLGKS